MLSSKLRFYRKKAGITQINLAKKLGISIATLRRWEAGETSPTGTKISEIAEILKIQPQALVSENDEEKLISGEIIFEHDDCHIELPATEKGYEIFNRLLDFFVFNK